MWKSRTAVKEGNGKVKDLFLFCCCCCFFIFAAEVAFPKCCDDIIILINNDQSHGNLQVALHIWCRL